MIKVGVVTARWNHEITDKLKAGALAFLESFEDVEIFSAVVPGAVEIPLASQALLESGCDGVVALGAVIRGDTSHYDYVCQSVTDGVTRLMLDYKKPIGFGILTTENEEQALARAGGDMGNKGEEAAQVVMEMIVLTQEIPVSMNTAKMIVNAKLALASQKIEEVLPAKKKKAPSKSTKKPKMLKKS